MYWFKEDEIEGLLKVQGENGEDLYMRTDVDALDDVRLDGLRNALFRGVIGQLQGQTEGGLMVQQFLNPLFIGPAMQE